MGVSRARVSQVLRLLELSPAVVETIGAIGESIPNRIVSERELRPLVNLSQEEQSRRVEGLVARLKD